MNVLFSKCSDAIDMALDTKSFGIFYSEQSTPNLDIHIHNCCEVLFCLSGGKTFFINERIYEVEDGDVFVINQYEAHKITADKNHTFARYVMQIHPEFLYHSSSPNTDLSKCFYTRDNSISHKLSLSTDEKEKLMHIFNKFSQPEEYADDILKRLASIEVLAVVNKHFGEKNKNFTYTTEYENNTIVEALKFINNNYSDKLSLDIVAKHCYTTVNELCKLFKKHMGTTVGKYICSRRIIEAKKLLKAGSSVFETAEKCGFADYANFIRVFKNAVGVPPGQYKKKDTDEPVISSAK